MLNHTRVLRAIFAVYHISPTKCLLEGKYRPGLFVFRFCFRPWPPDAAGRKLKSRRTGAGRAPDAAGRRRTQVEVSRTPPDARPKTTIGLGAPVEVFIYYLWPPAVVCHRGPPSTTRARVDCRTEMLAKLLNYTPRNAAGSGWES